MSQISLVFQREGIPDIFNQKIFAGKIYRSSAYWVPEKDRKGNELYAPVKGASEEERQRSKAADDLYAQAVSSVREAIEALFS